MAGGPELSVAPGVDLLQSIRQTEGRTAGRLKIFFSFFHGTGKSYAMLQAAFRAKAAGADVVAGVVTAQHFPATAALLAGLEQLPRPAGPDELDLDAALARRPQLLLVDRLAHTNRAGSRHLRRYQDVQELLRAGIDVYTTANVQDLESLSDMVTAITGTTPQERIPDPVFDAADELQVVDLDPAGLLQRFADGETLPGRVPTLQSLTALREMMLRRAADHLNKTAPLPGQDRLKTGEHILICLSGAPSNAKVIRTAARMAEAFHGGFTALFVESPDYSRIGEDERRRLQANLRLAEQLGARIATIYGDDPAVQIAAYARLSGISKIVLGRSPQRRSFWPGIPTLMDRLSTLAPDLDIYIIPDHLQAEHLPAPPRRLHAENVSLRATARMTGLLALCTLVGYLFKALSFSSADIIMVYILGVLCIAMVTEGRSYSLLASVLSVLIFNFCFTPPYFTLISSPGDFATFAVMFLVALLGSSLTVRNKLQTAQSVQKAYRTEVLLETSRKLQKAEDAQAIYAALAGQLGKLLERDLLLYPVGEGGKLLEPLLYPALPGHEMAACRSAAERAAAEWVLKNNKHAGATTQTFPQSACLYMAVRGSKQVLAVVGVALEHKAPPDAYEKDLLVAILDECGLALEKEEMVHAKQRMEETARQEALRANLLRAISHDLRTPLTSISGNARVLMENGTRLAEEKRQKLYGTIYDDALWLIDLVENLLSITRIENGTMQLHLQPELLDEIFHEALCHLDRNAASHEISVQVEDDLLLASIDARLIVQVLINLVNNAVKYTPEHSHITLSARRSGREVLVQVADDGPGIPDEAQSRLFEMFYTAGRLQSDSRRGLGLGLALCKSIVTAHGGRIWQENSQPHGSCFCFTLPVLEMKTHE